MSDNVTEFKKFMNDKWITLSGKHKCFTIRHIVDFMGGQLSFNAVKSRLARQRIRALQSVPGQEFLYSSNSLKKFFDGYPPVKAPVTVIIPPTPDKMSEVEPVPHIRNALVELPKKAPPPLPPKKVDTSKLEIDPSVFKLCSDGQYRISHHDLAKLLSQWSGLDIRADNVKRKIPNLEKDENGEYIIDVPEFGLVHTFEEQVQHESGTKFVQHVCLTEHQALIVASGYNFKNSLAFRSKLVATWMAVREMAKTTPNDPTVQKLEGMIHQLLSFGREKAERVVVLETENSSLINENGSLAALVETQQHQLETRPEKLKAIRPVWRQEYMSSTHLGAVCASDEIPNPLAGPLSAEETNMVLALLGFHLPERKSGQLYWEITAEGEKFSSKIPEKCRSGFSVVRGLWHVKAAELVVDFYRQNNFSSTTLREAFTRKFPRAYRQ